MIYRYTLERVAARPTMDSGVAAHVDLVADRYEFLTELAEEPARKPEIVDRTDTSRSTVDRAIRELTEADLVERTEGRYVTTTFGRLAA